MSPNQTLFSTPAAASGMPTTPQSTNTASTTSLPGTTAPTTSHVTIPVDVPVQEVTQLYQLL